MRVHRANDADPGSAAADASVLHASATTRVTREAGGIRKLFSGPGAKERRDHEKAILERLAGVKGVVQLAPDAAEADSLMLVDDGGESLSRSAQHLRHDAMALLSVGAQLARALAAVHRAGLVHCDVNPANIVLAGGRPVLIDFDLATPADQAGSAGREASIAGTLAYMAPEQTGRTGRALDNRSDLYALGVTLYELATGRLPFEAQEPLQLIHDHLVREPEAPSDIDPRVPQGLGNIVLRLLAKEPGLRYQSAEGLLHDLHRLSAEFERNRSGIFELGELDFPARLAPPLRLVGREEELKALQTAFAQAMASTQRTVLVEGSPGVGKSALIRELRPWVAASGGRFVYGKFDQYQRDAGAAGAVTQALRALGQLLLAGSHEELAALRETLVARLGRNAALAARQLPEFAVLLGESAQVLQAEPEPGRAEQRWIETTAGLLDAIAAGGRPLALVLDDMQWADAQSLRLFEQLMNDPSLRGVLLVGAYRGREIDSAHLLAPMLSHWKQQGGALLHLELQNLDEAGIGELVGLMLRLSPQRAARLAAALTGLTAGNPFDTVEVVNALRREGILDLAADGWHWDDAAIRRFAGQGSVIDLLAARVARLPAGARSVVECMSCLGSSVDHELLAAAAGQGPGELAEALRAPLEDGLLLPDPAGRAAVHFRHDRVQQAVLAGLPTAARAARQLGMARRLADVPELRRHAAEQYLGCMDAIRDGSERLAVARLFHDTAARLIRTANPSLAERYLLAARELLSRGDDPATAALANLVDIALHAALYSLGRMDEADTLYAQVQAGAADPLELVDATCLQMRSVYIRGRMRDALDLGITLLGRLGLHVPPGFEDPSIAGRLDALGAWVAQDRAIEGPAGRPPIEDRRLLGIANLLSRAFPPAFFLLDRKALVWLTLESQRLWAEHGPCAALVVALSRACMVLILTREDYRVGYDIVRHVLAAGAAQGFEQETLEGRHVFTISACHWFETLEDNVRHCVRTREALVQLGDASYASFSYRVSSEMLLDSAASLDDFGAEVSAGLALCRRSGNSLSARFIEVEQQLLRCLRGATAPPGHFTDGQFDEATFASTSVPAVVRITYHVRRALAAALFEDLPTLLEQGNLALALFDSSPGFHVIVHARLLRALALAWQLQGGSAAAPAEAQAELADCRVWLAARAAGQPYNFLHLLHWVEAEEAWALGDGWRAVACFDEAMDVARERQRPWHRAFITERAARCHAARGLAHTARRLLEEALLQYESWGASAKVHQLRDRHPGLEPAPPATLAAGGGSSRTSVDSLDLMGVLQASQALSSETSLERLAARVTDVLEALSGATKAHVLLWNDGCWWLLAPAPAESSIALDEAAARGLVPLSAVHYAERTAEPLLVDDAATDDRFARDPYFSGVPVCSLLATPIASQGGVRAMVVLENRLGRAAFNARRLDAVMLIAGQLAVSLANAQLYEQLEQRVQARTRELEQTQAQLVATARRAGKAEIAANVLHNVGNVLNSINVSANLVRRTVDESRAAGLARAVALMNERDGQQALGTFLDRDPRGRALLTYLNELVQALDAEKESTLADLDRLVRSVDHISYVVATQQSHTGPSTVLELVQPEDVLEEALYLSESAIARCAAAVEKHFAPMPAATLDRQRLVQVLVNLLANASQAMECVPESSRRLTLAAAFVDGDAGRRLRISVRDEGEGIAAEHMERLFSHGFTTRKDGHGFGLHSCALAAMEMGGRVTAHSDGPGRGATFTVDLPIGP